MPRSARISMLSGASPAKRVLFAAAGTGAQSRGMQAGSAQSQAQLPAQGRGHVGGQFVQHQGELGGEVVGVRQASSSSISLASLRLRSCFTLGRAAPLPLPQRMR